jgi:hypothetical protein
LGAPAKPSVEIHPYGFAVLLSLIVLASQPDLHRGSLRAIPLNQLRDKRPYETIPTHFFTDRLQKEQVT